MVGKKGERVVNSVVNPKQYDVVAKAMQAAMGWCCDKCNKKFLIGWSMAGGEKMCDGCVSKLMENMNEDDVVTMRKIVW